MNLTKRIGLLTATLFCGGCMMSSQEFVKNHSQGYFQVMGSVIRIEGLHLTKWDDLTDGFVLTVDDPGCKVTVRQGEEGASGTKKTRFDLVEGDFILHSPEHDYIISSLSANRPGPGGTTGDGNGAANNSGDATQGNGDGSAKPPEDPGPSQTPPGEGETGGTGDPAGGGGG